MNTPCKQQRPRQRRVVAAAGAERSVPHGPAGVAGTSRPRGGIRTCVPARAGQAGYREPAEAGPDAHIVRGED